MAYSEKMRKALAVADNAMQKEGLVTRHTNYPSMSGVMIKVSNAIHRGYLCIEDHDIEMQKALAKRAGIDLPLKSETT